MVRLFNVYHSGRMALLAGLEAVLVTVSIVVALGLSHRTNPFAILTHLTGVGQVLLTIGIYMLCLYYLDSYDARAFTNRVQILWRLISVPLIASIFLWGIGHFFPAMIVVHNIALAAVISLGLLIVCRFFFARLVRTHPASIILVGISDLGCELARETRRRPDLGIIVRGYIDDGQELPVAYVPVPCLGRISGMNEVIAGSRIDLLVVDSRERRGKLPVKELLQPRIRGMRVVDIGTFCEQVSGKIPFEKVFPSWLLFSDGFRLHRRLIILRRFYSCILSAFGLLISLPVMILVAIGIKLESSGPVLYSQERVGLDGRVFTLYKFRSMRQDAERNSGPTWAIDKDKRVTRIGRFLRASHLDELPQLWNVLRGDMNLVGPRPERPCFVKTLEELSPYYAYRHLVRPGVTGWQQVRQGYCSTVEEQLERLRYDLFYIKHISLSLDFYILFRTGRIILWGRGAK